MVSEVARRTRRVFGVDVSRGALACAEVLNGAPNVTYLHSDGTQLDAVASDSIGLVTSFAAIQHMDRRVVPLVFAEIARVLAPDGRALVQVALSADATSVPSGHGAAPGDRYRLRMESYSRPEVGELAAQAGLHVAEEPFIHAHAGIEAGVAAGGLFVLAPDSA